MHGVVTPEEIKRAKLDRNNAAIPTEKELADAKKVEQAKQELDRIALAVKAQAAGMKKINIRDAAGIVQQVWSFKNSYPAMGFNAVQIAAAERFDADWQAAYRCLRGQGYEASVDHARSQHGPHLAMVDAQTRLDICRRKLGARSWDIVVAVVVYGATARQIHAMGGNQHVAVSDQMKLAFNDLEAFYTGSQHKDRTWRAVESLIKERAAMIEAAEQGA